MAKLIGTTVVAHPETGEPAVLLEGIDLPEWANDLVGEHLLDEKPKAAAKANAKSE